VVGHDTCLHISAVERKQEVVIVVNNVLVTDSGSQDSIYLAIHDHWSTVSGPTKAVVAGVVYYSSGPTGTSGNFLLIHRQPVTSPVPVAMSYSTCGPNPEPNSNSNPDFNWFYLFLLYSFYYFIFSYSAIIAASMSINVQFSSVLNPHPPIE